jgi:hypothetical protein
MKQCKRNPVGNYLQELLAFPQIILFFTKNQPRPMNAAVYTSIHPVTAIPALFSSLILHS